MKKVLAIILSITVVFALGLAFAGCKAETAETTAAETMAAETTVAETTAAETMAAETTAAAVDVKIAYYWPQAHPYYESVLKGQAKFAEKYGIEVFSQVGTGWDLQTEIEQVEALVAQGYKGLAVYPVDASGTNSLYEEVVAAGTFVCSYGAQTQVPTPASFTLATDVKAAAMAATEKVIETMGEKGNILNIIEYVEDPNSILRKEGVEEVVAKYPDVKIIQTIAGMDSIEECTEKIGNALSGLGDQVNGMVTTGYNPTVASAQILTEMKNDKIAYVGIDDDPIVLKAIEDGYVTGTFAQSPYFQGYVTPILLMYLIQGHESKGFVFIDTYGIVVTKDNLGTFADELWDAAFKAGDTALETWFKS